MFYLKTLRKVFLKAFIYFENLFYKDYFRKFVLVASKILFQQPCFFVKIFKIDNPKDIIIFKI